MKSKIKYIIIGIVLVLIVVLIYIFHYDKVVCTNTIKEDDYTIKSTYTIFHKSKKVYKVKIERTIESKNTTIQSFFEKNYKDEFNGYNKDYGGYTVTSNNKDKTKTTVIADVNFRKVNMKKLLEGRSYLKEDISNNKIMVDGIYKLYSLGKNMCK